MGWLSGHPAVWLENDQLRVSVLPEKGADIYELVHRATGVDCLYKTRAGLQPPSPRPPIDIIEHYEGGWQELFPNTGDACRYRGIDLPVHGEVALLPWSYQIVRDDEAESVLRLWVDTPLTAFRLERLMCVRQGAATLEIVGRVENRGGTPAHFVWGHHLVVGGTFLEAGCRYDAAAGTLVVPDHPKEATRARLQAGQRCAWPVALGRNGLPTDLRHIPGPDVRSHDEVYLTDLTSGEASITNPRLGLTLRLRWDTRVFGCLVMWQPLGGLDTTPWTDSYGVGMEPWTAVGNLTAALDSDQALCLKPGQSLSTRLSVTLAPEIGSASAVMQS